MDESTRGDIFGDSSNTRSATMRVRIASERREENGGKGEEEGKDEMAERRNGAFSTDGHEQTGNPGDGELCRGVYDKYPIFPEMTGRSREGVKGGGNTGVRGAPTLAFLGKTATGACKVPSEVPTAQASALIVLAQADKGYMGRTAATIQALFFSSALFFHGQCLASNPLPFAMRDVGWQFGEAPQRY